MAMVRLFGLLFVACTLAYLLVSIYSRSIRTEKLEKRWDAEHPEGISREDYVRDGLKAYDASLRRRLILLIYVLPFVAVGVAIWLTNTGGYR
jgi:hypothetical protein